MSPRLISFTYSWHAFIPYTCCLNLIMLLFMKSHMYLLYTFFLLLDTLARLLSDIRSLAHSYSIDLQINREQILDT